MTDAQQTLAQVLADRDSGRLEQLCQDAGLELLVLFGSAVRHPGEAKDVDIAYLSHPTNPAGELDVVNTLGSTYGDGVDVMNLHRASVVARYEALCKGEVLVELVPGRFANAQCAAFGEFCDTQWLRDAQLEALSS